MNENKKYLVIPKSNGKNNNISHENTQEHSQEHQKFSCHLFILFPKKNRKIGGVNLGERCITLLSLDLTYYRHFLGEDLENKDILGVDRNKLYH